MFLAIRSPTTLTCRAQHQTVNCVYEIRGSGSLSGETIQIQDVKKAIISQKPSGERIIGKLFLRGSLGLRDCLRSQSRRMDGGVCRSYA